MIYFVRSWKVVPETRREGMEWIRKLAKYANEKWPEQTVELLTNLSGGLGQLRWVRKHESIGADEEWRKKSFADEGVKAIIAEAEGKIYFTDDVDTYYNIVEL